MCNAIAMYFTLHNEISLTTNSLNIHNIYFTVSFAFYVLYIVFKFQKHSILDMEHNIVNNPICLFIYIYICVCIIHIVSVFKMVHLEYFR